MEGTIRLNADLFMALGLSAEAHGGVGGVTWTDANGQPMCAEGLACWLDGGKPDSDGSIQAAVEASPTVQEIRSVGLTAFRNDCFLPTLKQGRAILDRIPFGRWCELVGVDVTA